jgi:glucose/arabinose dehydrogenase
LWEVKHGPLGGDEFNLIERGENYGPQWQGSGFISGLASQSLVRIIFDGRGGAKPAERWRSSAASAMSRRASMAPYGCWKMAVPAP